MEYNDYEVVSLAQEGNEDAISLLYQKYKPIIIKKSKNAIMYAPHHGIEISDIMQEAYIGLDEAIKNFSQDDSATFYTFAMVCIERKIFNYLILLLFLKHYIVFVSLLDKIFLVHFLILL